MADGRMFQMDIDSVDSLVTAIAEYGPKATKAANEVIHGSGAIISRRIDDLMPTSGRTFKGHQSGAKGSAWPRYDTENSLEITVGTISSRRYLYFPDDGSNTRRHYGGQEFFARGLEAATPDLLEKIETALAEAFGQQ